MLYNIPGYKSWYHWPVHDGLQLLSEGHFVQRGGVRVAEQENGV